MISTNLIILFLFIILLLVLSGFAMVSVMRAHDRDKRFQDRMGLAVSPTRVPTAVEEQVSLTKTVSRAEQIKGMAANFIGVDLQQSEAYPIKWWLIPPIGVLLSCGVSFLASHPLHSYAVYLYILATPFDAWLLTKFIFNWFNNRRNSSLLEQFPDALNTIVRCVRVGIPIGEALRTVSNDALEPTKAEFHILADKVSIGIPLDVALRELAMRIKLTEYQFFATALTLQARSGGGITQTLETLADVIRKRVGLKARGYALTAEARTSAMILAALPFIAGIAIFFMQRDYISMLFDTSSGEAVLGAAILLMCIGLGIIQFMISNVLK